MSKYKVGDEVVGTVTGITKYGVFVKIDENYSGLIHISEISDKYIYDINRLFNINDKITSSIIEIDDNNNQIKLSLKNNNISGKTSVIIEKGAGFVNLKNNLDIWIQEKLNEKEK